MNKMENSSIWIGIAIVAGACIGGWLLRFILQSAPSIEEEFADGEIAFDDMVAYFKSLHLKREDGSCTIVFERKEAFHKLLYKEGYSSFGLFVIDEKTNNIVKGKIIHAKGFDAKTHEVFNGHDIIKLT